ncbi:MAG: DUF86 domain-containing protein [Alphaproteobacteria bacterium]|nr:DUF86 domain-containing protein [Alphaproteobacteria bacterium]
MSDDRLYLSHIADSINQIRIYTRAGREEFLGNRLVQDGVIRNFEVIGEAAKRLSPAATTGAPAVPWRRVAGFRDVLIHNYMGIDLGAVWNVIENELPTLEREVRRLLQQIGTDTKSLPT